MAAKNPRKSSRRCFERLFPKSSTARQSCSGRLTNEISFSSKDQNASRSFTDFRDSAEPRSLVKRQLGASSPPETLPIFIDLANAVKGHAMQTALGISESECLRIVVREFQLLKSDDDDPIFHAVEVTQFKIPASELSVPSDSVQEFV